EELRSLQALRLSVTRWLHAQPLDEQNIRRLDTAQLAEICAGFPAYVHRPRSLAYYCQGLLRDGAPALVLNAIQSGFGRSIGRLRFIARQAAASRNPQEDTLAPMNWADPLPVAIQGVLAANINLRVDALPYEIVYPGSVSERPLTEQLSLADLYVVDDASTRRLHLFSKRLQRTITPVHTGLMSDLWMPPLYRFLVQAFGEGFMNPLRSLLLLGDPGISDLRHMEQFPVTHAPRLCLGRVCLSREHWVLPSTQVPRRDPEESLFGYFLTIQRWRQSLGLPSRCYARPNPGTSDGDRTAIQSMHSPSLPRFVKKYKPLYIDFENFFSVRMFERLAARNTSGLFLEEALPTPEDALFSDGHQSYASEFIIELNEER
ncbi:MAG TPA: lantibiotic dehydratase, partial [Ktedonobacteraceae bacterium]|nr:lantibiotic dehydratase [Ktedonobacteraceae bacterium]